MSFTSRYLTGQPEPFFHEAPDCPSMSVIVVIPCYNEPDLSLTLASLANCDCPGEEVGVVVVVNSHENTPADILEQNKRSIQELNDWQGRLPAWLHLFKVEACKLPEKWAGAGLARKIGFDWGISHFHQHGFLNGLLVSLDADTLVDKNYLSAVVQHFRQNEKTVALTVYFEHPVDGNEFDQDVYEAMVLYECYLRYYKQALQSVGFPNALYTLGSAFAVRANAYISMGGMNRRKAGEDFYFLHKMVQYGKVDELNYTTVYPSARPSMRVPFGTGPALMKYLNGERELLLTYPYELFRQLVPLFYLVPDLFREKGLTHQLQEQLPALLVGFLKESGLDEEMALLARNCGSTDIYCKRFFFLFDAFQVLKWLNYNLREGIQKRPLVGETIELLTRTGLSDEKIPRNPKLLLNLLRHLDRSKA